MRKLILLLLIFPLGFLCKAQSLEAGTFSSFATDTELLSGTGGEAIVLPVSVNEGLYAGLMEILRSGKIEVDVPTGLEDPEEDIKIRVYTKESNLIVETIERYRLQIVTIGGALVINEEIEGTFSQPLPTGIYVVLLTNKTNQAVYKINIR